MGACYAGDSKFDKRAGGHEMSRYRYKITSDNKARIVGRLNKEGIAYWQLGKALGCHENTVAKLLRDPSDEDMQRILAAIDEIAAAQE